MTLDAVLSNIAIPGVVGLIMLVVGLTLTIADFRRVAHYPKAVIVAVIGQVIALPLIAALLIWGLAPPPYMVAGIILVAASPGGALSNLYTYLARGNTALSVTLTAISSLLSLIKLPVVATIGFAWLLDFQGTVDVPVVKTIQQLIIMLIIPITGGMFIRAQWPDAVARWQPAMQRISLIALAALVGIILYLQRANLMGDLGDLVTAAILYSVLAMATGWLIGKAVRLPDTDCFTLLLEFTARNLGITAVIGVVVLGRSDFILFATIFFLVQTPLMVAMVGIRRLCTSTEAPIK